MRIILMDKLGSIGLFETNVDSLLLSDYDVDDYKLQTLCNYYDIPLVGAHRALADCYATGLLLECLAKDRE